MWKAESASHIRTTSTLVSLLALAPSGSRGTRACVVIVRIKPLRLKETAPTCMELRKQALAQARQEAGICEAQGISLLRTFSTARFSLPEKAQASDRVRVRVRTSFAPLDARVSLDFGSVRYQ
jgi:hypothetical protein